MAATAADAKNDGGSVRETAKTRTRGKRRDQSQNDSGIEVSQVSNARKSKRRATSPKVESPPKKSRHQSKPVTSRNSKEELPSSEEPTQRLSISRRGASKAEKATRKKNATKQILPEESESAPIVPSEKRTTSQKTNSVSNITREESSAPSKKLRPRQRKKPLKEISDDDIFDDLDEDYAPSKQTRTKLKGKSVDVVKSETSDSEAEPELKIKKKREPKPERRIVQPKKMFTKPRRPISKQITIDKTNETAGGSSGITSSAHERRLLLIARQMDGTDGGDKSNTQTISEKTEMIEKNKNEVQNEETRRALIMGMLKEHEEVAEMSDDSDGDIKDKDKLDKVSSNIDAIRQLPSGQDDSKKGEPAIEVKNSRRQRSLKKESTAKKGKASKAKPVKEETSSSDDEDDWEVVGDGRAQDPNYQRPDKVTVVLKNEDFLPDAKRLDMEQRMMRLINRRRKAVQSLAHKVHLICLFAYQRYINSIIEDDILKALALSRMPADLVVPLRPTAGPDSHFVKSILLYCKGAFEYTQPSADTESFSVKFLSEKLRVLITKRMTSCNIVYLLGIVIIMRAMGVPTRLCFSHQPVSHKPVQLRRKDGEMVEFKPKAASSEGILGVLDYFAEVYLADRRCWRPIDIEDHRIIDDPHEMGIQLDQPILYVISIDAENAMKDLTAKYHSNWLSKGVKLRPEGAFLEQTLALYAPTDDKEDHLEEQKEVADLHEKQGLPKTISEYKNHPRYVLARHLLKFEAIYPRDAEVLGYVNKEPVYRRECVKLLRSKDTWHRHGRQVIEGEIAYNVVKARPKWDRRNEVLIKDLPLEVFGEWQTEPYKPPVAENGRVPRNKFGNVELFHEDMLPIGTVHLKLPGLNRIADELGIDCVPAVVGFEGVARGCHPVIEGFVVCVEHKETLEAAWSEIQNEDRRKRRERIRKRAQKNWRKIIGKVMWEIRLKKKSDNKS